MKIAHPFARRDFNPRDENGEERCAICGYVRGGHAADPVRIAPASPVPNLPQPLNLET